MVNNLHTMKYKLIVTPILRTVELSDGEVIAIPPEASLSAISEKHWSVLARHEQKIIARIK